MKILVTGAAGFIGAAVSQYLINRGDTVVGIDNINDYYDVNLKHARLETLQASDASDKFSFIQMGVEERDAMAQLFEEQKFDRVVHLAAQLTAQREQNSALQARLERFEAAERAQELSNAVASSTEGAMRRLFGITFQIELRPTRF